MPGAFHGSFPHLSGPPCANVKFVNHMLTHPCDTSPLLAPGASLPVQPAPRQPGPTTPGFFVPSWSCHVGLRADDDQNHRGEWKSF